MFDAFRSLTNNQVYNEAFRKRMMEPDPKRPGHFLGNNQREHFLPDLISIIQKLPFNPKIMDLGAGSGEIVNLAFQHLNTPAELHIEEPNGPFLASYLQEVEKLNAKTPHLTVSATYAGPVQDFWNTPEKVPASFTSDKNFDLILALHMIYFIKNEDLPTALLQWARSLKVGGHLYLTYADQTRSTTGRAAVAYFEASNQPDRVKSVAATWANRNSLLLDKGIIEILKTALPGSEFKLESKTTESEIFGPSIQDIAVQCMAGELGEANDQPFQIEKLLTAYRYVDQNRDSIGLRMDKERNRWASKQPQVIVDLQRLK